MRSAARGLVWATLAAAAACQGQIGEGPAAPAAPGPRAATPSVRPAPSPSPTASPTAAPLPEVPALAAGVRRLSRREIVEAIAQLFPGLQVEALTVDALPADTRQADFTRNRAQIVDPVFASALEALAIAVAEAVADEQPLACGATDQACAHAALEALAERAFRGPLDDATRDGLRAVYAVGLAEGGARLGHALVVQAVLESPSFLYTRELTARLDGRALAEALAALVTGDAPDAALLARAGELDRAAVRGQEARRLYATPRAQAHLARALAEWLRLDRLDEIAKDATAYPDFFALRPSMGRETDALLARALAVDADTLSVLLTTRDTALDPLMQRFYAGQDRPGVLTRAAFLSVYASPTESSPVRRGNAILSRLACVELPLPVELMIDIVPPTPDPSLTTRERYARHATDAACRGCHQQIDPLGFALEGFDGMGAARTEENGRPVDTVADVVSPPSLAGRHAGPAPLMAALAASAEVEACFVRHVLRYAAGTRDDAFEAAMVARWRARPAGAPRGLLDVLLAYVESDAFTTREVR